MSLETNQQAFLLIYDTLQKRPGSDALKEFLMSCDFFIAPASTKFHGNFKGGLCSHSLSVDTCLTQLINTLLPNESDRSFTMDEAHFSALLHDVCKINFYKIGYRNVKDDSTGRWEKKEVYEIDEKTPVGYHADKSVILLQDFVKLTPNEIYAIRAHMGGFDASVKGGDYTIGKIFEKNQLAVLLHAADLMSSYLFETKDNK